MRGKTAALAALCAALALHAPAARAKDDLVIGVAQFPSTLHPDIDAEVIKAYVDGFVVRQITAYDKDWHNSCLICETLPTLANGLARLEDRPDGKKGMAVTLKLKPGLKWADGVPVTAKDIAFTWKLGRDPANGFSNTNPWGRATSVDVVDDQTAVMHLDRQIVSYNQWDQVLPEHVEGPIFAKAANAAEYINATAYNHAPTTPGLWDGPYMVTAYQSGSSITLEPNPYWPGTKPGFKKIVIRLVENTAALQANLLSGDVDMVAGEGIGLTIDQAIALRQQHPDQFTYIFKPSLTYEHIDLQKNDPILQDGRVRHAMLYAMDRKTLTQKLFAGLQPVADSWVNPLDQEYDKDIPSVPYDLGKAKSLLAEAGWTPGPDGICRNAKGDRLSLQFATTAGNRLRELTQQVLQSQLKAACIETTISNEPARTFFGQTVKQRSYGGLAMYSWSSAVDESPERTLGSADIPTKENNYAGANYVAFSDPKMDADIATAQTELDPGRQKAVWADMQQIYVDKLPVLPLFFRAEPHVIPKWLKGYEPTGTSDMACFWAENWHSG